MTSHDRLSILAGYAMSGAAKRIETMLPPSVRLNTDTDDDVSHVRQLQAERGAPAVRPSTASRKLPDLLRAHRRPRVI